MIVNCSTCLDLLSPNDELSSVPCGHLFHTTCILRWFETGKSNCPQCRTRCQQSGLRRVFFSEAQGLSTQDSDPERLQSRIDSLSFQLKCVEQEKKKLHEDRDELLAKNVSLKEEFRNCERDKQHIVNEKMDLETKIKYCKADKLKLSKAKEEAEELKTKLHLFESLEEIVKGSQSQVNNRLHDLGDFSPASRELCIIIECMKKEMNTSKKEREDLRMELRESLKKVNELQSRLVVQNRETTELKQMNQALISDLRHAEEDKENLKQRCDEIAKRKEKEFDPDLTNLIAISPPKLQKFSSLNLKMIDTENCSSQEDGKQFVKSKSQPADVDTSPFLKTKSVSIVGLKETRKREWNKRSPFKDSSNNQADIFSQMNIMKKSRLLLDHSSKPKHSTNKNTEGQFFNGLGGHSRPDNFPKPLGPGYNLKALPNSKKPKGIAKMPQEKISNRTLNKFFNLDTP